MNEKNQIEWTQDQLEEVKTALTEVGFLEWKRGYSSAYIGSGIALLIIGGILKVKEMIRKKK